ncbi:MAG TPA: alkaline phosphatase family protein [Tepidisphaeraceae bacterium]|jgi:hypothetical protein
MSDRDRILFWFEKGMLVRPRAADLPTSVDLIRALAVLGGANDLPLSDAAQRLVAQIGRFQHYVLAIVDGLGLELLNAQLQTGFLLENLRGKLEAVFPSTTGAAMTSLSTGAYPAEHSVPGWWVWLEEYDLSAVSLPFVDRMSGRDLRSFNVKPASMFPVPSLMPRMTTHTPTVVTLRPFVGSVYSEYSSGSCRRVGYETLDEGIDVALRVLDGSKGPSFTQLYMPQLDDACHVTGVDSASVGNLLRAIDRKLARLRSSLPAGARLIVTADHGHVNLPSERRLFLKDGDRLLDTLRAPPSGEPAVPIFHVKPRRATTFARQFRERFGELFALLTLDEVDDLRLLGPDPLSPQARKRFGDFLAIPWQPTGLGYVPPGYAESRHIGIHAGLTAGEMFVPFVIS